MDGNLDKQQLTQSFLEFLPKKAVLFHDDEITPYECDGLSAYRKTPLVVLLPDEIDQVQQILKFCFENKIPVVARGAGTGLSGHQYWRIGERQAVRNGDWKMILDNGMSGPGLFDLARDVSEKKDLATEHPEKLAALTALYEAWAKGLPPPQVNTKHGRLKRVRKAQ